MGLDARRAVGWAAEASLGHGIAADELQRPVFFVVLVIIQTACVALKSKRSVGNSYMPFYHKSTYQWLFLIVMTPEWCFVCLTVDTSFGRIIGGAFSR